MPTFNGNAVFRGANGANAGRGDNPHDGTPKKERIGESGHPIGSPLDNEFEDIMRRKSQREGW